MPAPTEITEGSNKFILSKGHASLGLYVVLAEMGYFPTAWFDTFAKFESNLGGHPDSRKIPGVEASTGSLGHGLPIAVGVALGKMIKKEDARIFVLIGDGEMNEGAIWESLLLASHHKLGNLTVMIDMNNSTNRALTLGNLVEKIKSFGWNAVEIDGHNHHEIEDALNSHTAHAPTAIVARTTKGFGIKEMENNPAWHHASPNSEQLAAFLVNLE
jgi:transketolase